MQNAQNKHASPDGIGRRTKRPIERGVIFCPDMGAYQDAHEGTWETADVQLDPGPLNARIAYASTGDATVYHERFGAGIRAGGSIGRGYIAFCTPGRPSVGARWWGSSHPAGTLPFARGNEEIDTLFPARHNHTVLLIQDHVFRRIYEAVTATEPKFLDRPGNLVSIERKGIARLESDWNRLIHGTDDATTCPEMADLDGFSSSAVEALSESIGARARIHQASTANRSIVRRAIELDATSDGRMSVLDLCLQLHVSKRSLEYAFKDQLHLSPAAYFAIKRLNECRERLIHADPETTTVTQVANECGFSELGRFAGRFHRFFGEYPSQTLKRNPTRSVTGWSDQDHPSIV